MVRNLPVNARRRDTGSILGLERSPGGGHGDPFQYFCLENPMDRGPWKVLVHRITKSQIVLNNFTHTCTFYNHVFLIDFYASFIK